MKKHMIQMVAVGGIVLAGLVTFGVPFSTALRFAVVLACPLMMMWMMTTMNHSGGHSAHDHGAGDPDEAARPRPAPAAIASPRVDD
jgi:hypothetical protein